jgi:hypothetical protein
MDSVFNLQDSLLHRFNLHIISSQYSTSTPPSLISWLGVQRPARVKYGRGRQEEVPIGEKLRYTVEKLIVVCYILSEETL